MSKKAKILLIIALFIVTNIFCNYAFATEGTNTLTSKSPSESSNTSNLSSTSTSTSTSNTTNEVIKENTVNPSDLSNLSPNTDSSVQSIYSYSESNLHLNNILSIILIAIGILLILFAIALLIRLKK